MRTFTIPLKIRSITTIALTLHHQRNICKIKVILTLRLLDLLIKVVVEWIRQHSKHLAIGSRIP
jgi:hypothetical protein